MSKTLKLNLPRTSTSVEEVLEMAMRRLPLKFRTVTTEDTVAFRDWLRTTARWLVDASLQNCRRAAAAAMGEMTALMLDPDVHDARKRRRTERKERRRLRAVFGDGPTLLDRKPKTRTIQ
jgi:hypothetical protein